MTRKVFIFDISAKKMNEMDVLKLRIKELEETVMKFSSLSLSSNLVLFSHTATGDISLNKGWNTIVLNRCSEDSNKFIQFDKQNGYIVLSRGAYSIEAEATVRYVDVNILQIKSVVNDKISIYGSSQHSHSYQGAGQWTTSSRIPRQKIIIEDDLSTLML